MSPVESLNPDASFKHWIASDLRFYRERAGMSLAAFGQIVGCNRHAVSNYEHARDGWNLQEGHADKLDAYFELNGHFARLVRYARSAHDPDWFAEYARHETRALAIRLFRLSLVPGLLQTPEYARAVITASRMVDDVEAAVRERMLRKAVLERKNPPHVWIVMDESVLHRPIGGHEVMREQLGALLEATRARLVTVRVVPQSSDYYLGLGGSFNSLTMERGDLAFVEAPGGGRLIQDQTEIREFGLRWDRIGASALPWETSRDLIAKAMERYS